MIDGLPASILWSPKIMVLSYDHAILPAMLLSMGAWSRSSQSAWSVLQALGIGSIVGMWPSLASVKFNEGGVVEISEDILFLLGF